MSGTLTATPKLQKEFLDMRDKRFSQIAFKMVFVVIQPDSERSAFRIGKVR